MNRWTVPLWWPPVGLLAMVLLGVAVGERSTRLDDWFIRTGETHSYLGWLLFFTDGRVLLAVFVFTLAAALYRGRRRLAVLVAVTPGVALVTVETCKRLFGREKGGALAYPSGHVTLTAVVTGMAVLAVGVTLWAVVAGVSFTVLGLVGQAFGYHYFTDTVGAVFLGTALLGLATWAVGLDRCQPRCDLSHSSG